MRCGCPHCENFMVQQEERANACVCPACGYRCTACLGTGTALTREQVLGLKGSDWFTPSFEGAQEEEDPGFTIPERPDAPTRF